MKPCSLHQLFAGNILWAFIKTVEVTNLTLQPVINVLVGSLLHTWLIYFSILSKVIQKWDENDQLLDIKFQVPEGMDTAVITVAAHELDEAVSRVLYCNNYCVLVASLLHIWLIFVSDLIVSNLSVSNLSKSIQKWRWLWPLLHINFPGSWR